MDQLEPPSTVRRRQPRRNYDEFLLDELIDDHLGPSLSSSHKKTLAEREKETEIEALIALSLGFPIDALLAAESAAGVIVGPEEENDYIVVRNYILARWGANVRSWITKPQIRESVSRDFNHLISVAFDFLSEQGYMNFGSRFPDEHYMDSVLIV